MKKAAIIVGASSGIGEQTAYKLADIAEKETLDKIFLIARRKDLLENVARKVDSIAGRPLSAVCCGDITDNNFLEKISSGTEGEFEVSWLINSAGCGFYGNVDKVSAEKSCLCTELNCTSAVRVTAHFLPYINKGGHIIEMASSAAFFPQPGFAVYAASKAFVLSFSRALGRELKPRKISVTAVCPGPCETEFLKLANGGKEIPAYKRRFMTSPVNVAEKAIKAALKGKKICFPTFSMRLLYLASKVIPASRVMFFQSKL